MSAMVYAVIDTNILVSARISKNPLAATVKVVASMFHNRIIPVYNEEIPRTPQVVTAAQMIEILDGNP